MQKKEKRTLIDLFAGCGGLSLGMENAGFVPVFVNEINPIFCNTYIKNHKLPLDNYYIGDINLLIDEISKYSHLIKEVDLICGGPPCQGFSTANRQRIIDDPRNVLYKSYLKFLKYSKPKFFLMENVRGMQKKIDEILENFQLFLGSEYNFSYSILNAKDFGIPQSRDRFFLIGNRIGVPSEVIFERVKDQGKRIKKFILKDALLGMPSLEPKKEKNNNSIENDKIGFSETSFKYNKNDFYEFINGNREIKKLYNHKNRYNNERDVEIYKRLPQGCNSLHESIADIMPYTKRNHIFKDKYFKLEENKVCRTITSHMKYDCNMYIHPWDYRGLSPREAARIQTFPDDYIFYGSHNSWYAQIGNAVPVKLAEVIGKEIYKCLK